MNMYIWGIREQDPLKQGLKHRNFSPLDSFSRVIREQDPLKQGLKRKAGARWGIFE